MTNLPTEFDVFKNLSLGWVSLSGHGLEQLTLELIDDRLTATGTVVGSHKGAAFGIWYQGFFTTDWQIKAVSVYRTDNRWFIANSPQPGQWCDGDGKALPQLDGCIDIDLAFSPFTNSLPVRRLSWHEGQARDFTMAMIDTETLNPRPHRQRYRCITPGRQFHYQAVDGDFSTTIDFDRFGMVENYPDLFKRFA